MSSRVPPEDIRNAISRYQANKDEVEKWIGEVNKNLSNLITRSSDTARALDVLLDSCNDRKLVNAYYRRQGVSDPWGGHSERAQREMEAFDKLDAALIIKHRENAAAASAKAAADQENEQKRQLVEANFNNKDFFPPLGGKK